MRYSPTSPCWFMSFPGCVCLAHQRSALRSSVLVGTTACWLHGVLLLAAAASPLSAIRVLFSSRAQVYFSGWFGISNLNEVLRTRRPLILWDKQDLRSVLGKGKRVFSLAGEHLELSLAEVSAREGHRACCVGFNVRLVLALCLVVACLCCLLFLFVCLYCSSSCGRRRRCQRRRRR